MVEINGIAIYRCLKAEERLEELAVFDTEGVQQEDNETVRNVAEDLIENQIGDPEIGSRQRTPEYGDSKSARIHEYSAAASVERDNGFVTTAVLEELRESESIEENSRALAEWYLNETQSRSDLLLVVPYTYDDENFVGIIKTPYLDDAYQTDPSEILKEAERIIQQKTHKGIIHPRYDKAGDRIITDEAKVYQSGRYADYWYNFINLSEKKLEDEALVEAVADGSGAVAGIQATSEFSELPDRVDDDRELRGQLKIEISGISLDVEVGDLADENVRLAQRGGTYFVIFTGGDIDIEANDGINRQALPELRDFDDLQTALSDYL